MQTLLLLTIVSGLVAGDVLLPASLDAQASSTTHPTKPAGTKPAMKAATKQATAAATKPSTTARSTGKISSVSAGRLAPKAATTTAGAATATAARVTTPPVSQARDTSVTALAGAVAPVGTTALRDAPNGQTVASISPQTTLIPLSYDRGWVRVRAEGWVKESDVATVDPSHATVSAAELHADPDGARGKTVRWNIEVLALSTADPLRKGLTADEPYLLARGPGPESVLLYVAVPPALLATARAVASRAPTAVALVATVRDGRSEPVGVPILDALSLVRR